MTWKAPTEPAYAIVLDDEQLEDLGRFVAIISQCDHMIYQIIGHVSGVYELKQRAMLDGTTLGARLAMLRRLADTAVTSSAMKRELLDLCSAVESVNGKRNHIMHGIWGMYWDMEKNTVAPACTYERNSKSDIYASQLPELCERAAILSLKIYKVLRQYVPGMGVETPSRFFITKGTPKGTPPNWQPKPSRRSRPPNPEPDQTKPKS